MSFKPRTHQKQVLNYQGGKMGVSAVPGSGKTHTLSALAAKLIKDRKLRDDQEVLVVTLVNSAVDNFINRIGSMVESRGLLAHLGYRVRTLHGLAHDIVRERPALVGLDNTFQIIDEPEANEIREQAAQAWLRSHAETLDGYFSPDLEDNKREWARGKQLPELVNSLALAFIRYAKDQEVTPEALRERLASLPVPLILAEMGYAIYHDYQRALAYRGAVDFDDLIRLALQALRADGAFLQRLQDRWPYILEDEAQDSSRLQEEILRTLSGATGNWVRVGDPNQAIYETFTTASPEYLRRFLRQVDVTSVDLPESGRSTLSIIGMANQLIRWARADHPVAEGRAALDEPFIKPTRRRDPQPNPPDQPEKIHLHERKLSAQQEIETVVKSVAAWLPEHPNDTVAVLTPRNQRGFEVVEALKEKNIPLVDNLRSSSSTRETAGALGDLVKHLADPGSPARLAQAYMAWRRTMQADPAGKSLTNRTAELICKCRNVEEYLWPRPGHAWLDVLTESETDESLLSELAEFARIAQRWQGTALLPVDQMILSLSQDLFQGSTELAVAHKLASALRRSANLHVNWRLPELNIELGQVAHNERRFIGFSEDDSGFDPEAHRGKVVVATIHKAKGLEWDRVYLMSANNYDFPSGQPNDRYISEKWFVRDNLNLEAEAIAQLKAVLSVDEYDFYEERQATLQARADYVAERLRLFFVGLTRARKELIITWNTGRDGNLNMALPFAALQGWWEQQQPTPGETK